ncbi:hypothetical protein EJ02DRAFT_419562 [Clathrospora elynae]|uniref:Uncharacterized protein n=1 Tax=Clathrospora elynae TaxID=706981 RepID=A0A6A5SXY7_9PLEO|nr:hypothetical protein EJ02DRAFT_419562 [Clathrospora elynae]
MDFLAQLDERLQQSPQPKSRLAPYFEAHILFQDLYNTPSPSSPSSPEPEQPIMTTSPRVQPRSSPAKKRKLDAEDQCSLIHLSRKRRKHAEATAMPSPSMADESLPILQQVQPTRPSTGAASSPATSSEPQDGTTRPLSAIDAYVKDEPEGAKDDPIPLASSASASTSASASASISPFVDNNQALIPMPMHSLKRDFIGVKLPQAGDVEPI